MYSRIPYYRTYIRKFIIRERHRPMNGFTVNKKPLLSGATGHSFIKADCSRPIENKNRVYCASSFSKGFGPPPLYQNSPVAQALAFSHVPSVYNTRVTQASTEPYVTLRATV